MNHHLVYDNVEVNVNKVKVTFVFFHLMWNRNFLV